MTNIKDKKIKTNHKIKTRENAIVEFELSDSRYSASGSENEKFHNFF